MQPNDPKSGSSSKEQALAGNPLRREEKFYRGARPGASMEEVTRRKNFNPSDDFIDDLDDENELDEKLVEAGVDSPFEDQEDKHIGDPDPAPDREFKLNEQATQTLEGNLEEEDQDLNQLPKTEALKADRNL